MRRSRCCQRTQFGSIPRGIATEDKDSLESLRDQLESVWSKLYAKGIDRDLLLSRSLLSPSTCCLVNPDLEKTVEKGFLAVKGLSEMLRTDYGLGGNR